VPAYFIFPTVDFILANSDDFRKDEICAFE
jgi:hypothetical protein